MIRALLLIDIQNDYFDGGAMELYETLKAAKNARKLLEFFRKTHQSIFHIQHISNRENATFFLPNTNGVLINENLTPMQGEEVIIKNTPNSFHHTNLLEKLKSKNITNLVISGMMSHMCVDSTTRAAKDLGFSCEVISDACTTRNLVSLNGDIISANNVHKSFMAALEYYYATILNTDDFLLNFNLSQIGKK